MFQVQAGATATGAGKKREALLRGRPGCGRKCRCGADLNLIFGARSRFLRAAPDDPQADLSTADPDMPSPGGAPSGVPRRRGQRRGSTGHGRRDYSHLPTTEEVSGLPAEHCRCQRCGQPFAPFPGSDDTTVLEVEVKAGQIVLAFCWAHQRRDFVELARRWPNQQEWAQEWLERIGALHHLNERRLERREDSEGFAQRAGDWRQAVTAMATQAEQELAVEALHPARRKVLESLGVPWTGLTVFVEHPEVPMDNNTAERAERGPVVGRKNDYGRERCGRVVWPPCCSRCCRRWSCGS